MSWPVVCDDVDSEVTTSIDMSENNLWGSIPIELSLLENIGELIIWLHC